MLKTKLLTDSILKLSLTLMLVENLKRLQVPITCLLEDKDHTKEVKAEGVVMPLSQGPEQSSQPLPKLFMINTRLQSYGILEALRMPLKDLNFSNLATIPLS